MLSGFSIPNSAFCDRVIIAPSVLASIQKSFSNDRPTFEESLHWAVVFLLLSFLKTLPIPRAGLSGSLLVESLEFGLL